METLYFCDFSGGGGPDPLSPPLDPCMLFAMSKFISLAGPIFPGMNKDNKDEKSHDMDWAKDMDGDMDDDWDMSKDWDMGKDWDMDSDWDMDDEMKEFMREDTPGMGLAKLLLVSFERQHFKPLLCQSQQTSSAFLVC